jgi:hypothetical protein
VCLAARQLITVTPFDAAPVEDPWLERVDGGTSGRCGGWAELGADCMALVPRWTIMIRAVTFEQVGDDS